MNQESLQKALEQLPEHLQCNLSKNLCVCNDVPKQTIINAILNGARNLEEIKEKTYASEGSACCKQQIEQLLKYLQTPKKG